MNFLQKHGKDTYKLSLKKVYFYYSLFTIFVLL